MDVTKSLEASLVSVIGSAVVNGEKMAVLLRAEQEKTAALEAEIARLKKQLEGPAVDDVSGAKLDGGT